MFENNEALKNTMHFVGILFAIFIISFLIFSFLGLAPKSLSLKDYFWPDQGSDLIRNLDQAIALDTTDYIRPDRITIPKIGVNTIIEQPNTRDVSELDRLLQNGAVHYPGSGSVSAGNMFIFGHSTGFSVVQNPAYKAFNNLEDLSRGDEIEIFADGDIYIYKVTKVTLVNDDQALVEFNNTARTLTISTCNTFGAKQERWVVEAEFYREV
jgi:LPXTG-site transpeptidase (sortase) family protein